MGLWDCDNVENFVFSAMNLLLETLCGPLLISIDFHCCKIDFAMYFVCNFFLFMCTNNY